MPQLCSAQALDLAYARRRQRQELTRLAGAVFFLVAWLMATRTGLTDSLARSYFTTHRVTETSLRIGVALAAPLAVYCVGLAFAALTPTRAYAARVAPFLPLVLRLSQPPLLLVYVLSLRDAGASIDTATALTISYPVRSVFDSLLFPVPSTVEAAVACINMLFTAGLCVVCKRLDAPVDVQPTLLLALTAASSAVVLLVSWLMMRGRASTVRQAKGAKPTGRPQPQQQPAAAGGSSSHSDCTPHASEGGMVCDLLVRSGSSDLKIPSLPVPTWLMVDLASSGATTRSRYSGDAPQDAGNCAAYHGLQANQIPEDCDGQSPPLLDQNQCVQQELQLVAATSEVAAQQAPARSRFPSGLIAALMQRPPLFYEPAAVSGTLWLKVPFAEPDELPDDYTARLDERMRNAGLCATHIAVRAGCIELVLSLRACGAGPNHLAAAAPAGTGGGGGGRWVCTGANPFTEPGTWVATLLEGLGLPAPPATMRRIHAELDGRVLVFEYDTTICGWRILEGPAPSLLQPPAAAPPALRRPVIRSIAPQVLLLPEAAAAPLAAGRVPGTSGGGSGAGSETVTFHVATDTMGTTSQGSGWELLLWGEDGFVRPTSVAVAAAPASEHVAPARSSGSGASSDGQVAPIEYHVSLSAAATAGAARAPSVLNVAAGLVGGTGGAGPDRPVLLLPASYAAVATELQQAVADWPAFVKGPDQLLADVGTWLAQTHATVYGSVRDTAAAPRLPLPELPRLGGHLLQFACRYGMRHLVRRVVAGLAALGVPFSDLAPGGLLTQGSTGLLACALASRSPAMVGQVLAWQLTHRLVSSVANRGAAGSSSSAALRAEQQAHGMDTPSPVAAAGVASSAAHTSVASGSGSGAEPPPSPAERQLLARASRAAGRLGMALAQTLGFRRGASTGDEEASYRAYLSRHNTIGSGILHVITTVVFILFIARQPAPVWYGVAATVPYFGVACVGSVSWMLLQADAWARMAGGLQVLLRLGMATSCLLMGTVLPFPQVLYTFWFGAGPLAMEGMLTPSCAVPPATELFLVALKYGTNVLMEARMCAAAWNLASGFGRQAWGSCSADPWVIARRRPLAIACLSVATNLAVHTYLRLCAMQAVQRRQSTYRAPSKQGPAAANGAGGADNATNNPASVGLKERNLKVD